MNLEKFPTSEAAKQMLEYVTQGWYDRAYVAKWLYQVMGLTMDQVKGIYEDLPAQFFVETATWGLSYHEQKYGLPVREYLSYEDRRKLIYARRDYRVPITPYNLEAMIHQQLGYNAEVSDIHDLGSRGYIPEHPNIFQVVILERDINQGIDYGAVERLVNRAKQSHTTYITVHRQEFNRSATIYTGAVATELVCYEVKPRQLNRDVTRKARAGTAAISDMFITAEIAARS